MAKVQEAYSERDQKINAKGEVIEIEIPYIVFEAADEDAALTAAKSVARSVSGMSLSAVEVDERINEDTWKVKAIYEEDDGGEEDDEEEESSFAFDTGGGTMHLNQSYKTVGKFPNDAPDFNGAIEVDNEGNVNGVDVTMPVLNFTETHTINGGRVTTSYKNRTTPRMSNHSNSRITPRPSRTNSHVKATRRGTFLAQSLVRVP